MVWWLRAEQPETLAADLAALAGPLGLPEAAAREQQVVLDAVHRWLGEHDGWMLVADNAEPTEQTTGLFPDGPGRLLVTSRDVAWRRQATALLPVEVLERDEAVRLLRRRTGDRDTAAAGQLAEVLGDLPLALEQAGAYCEGEQLPLAGYLDRLRTDTGLFTEGQPVDYTHTVATTWTLGVEEAATRSPHAPALLRLLAYLGPDEIPWDLLGPTLTEWEEVPVLLGGLSIAELDRAMGALSRYSLVKRIGDDVTVHRLVLHVVRNGLDPEEQRGWAAAAVGLVMAAFPYDSDWPQTWPICQRLLPHALVAAEHAEALQTAALHTSALLSQVGLYFRGRSQFTAAQATYERALRLGQAAYGPDHPVVATTINNLGRLLRELGDPEGARAKYEQAVTINTAVYGADHPTVATGLNNLAYVLLDLGDLDGARAHFERALGMVETAYGLDHPIVARTVSSLGGVLQQQGDLACAQANHERALRIFEAAYGPQHPDVATAHNYLGSVLRESGDLDGARAHFERALGIVQAAYGPDHPNVARSVYNLGLTSLATPTRHGSRPTGACWRPSRLRTVSWSRAEHASWPMRLSTWGISVRPRI